MYIYGWIFFVILLFSNLVIIFPTLPPQEMTVLAQQQLSSALTARTNDRVQHLIEITAGKIQNFSFRIDLSNRSQGILNYHQQPITDIAVFITSQSSSVKVVGPTTWSLPRIDANSSRLVTTKVYASPSVIGDPVFLLSLFNTSKTDKNLRQARLTLAQLSQAI